MPDVPEKLEGRYFPAGSARSHPATLRYSADTFIVSKLDDGAEISLDLEEVGDRLANVPRKIRFRDGSVFECGDNDAVDAAFGRHGHFFSRMSFWEASWKHVAIAVVVTVAVVLGLYRYGLPVAANVAAWATPTVIVEQVDSSALETVDEILFNPTSLDEDVKAKYLTIFEELRQVAELQPGEVRLLFRDGGRLGANAVALPGGTVILTDQLAALAENEDEIAGVLAHEIGHYTGRHSLRQIYRALGIGFLAALVVGDASTLVDNLVGQLALLDTLSYSRAFENEADETSVAIMIKADRNPLAFVDLLERIYEDAGVEDTDSGWLSTHPGNLERRENVLKQMEAAE